MTYGFVREDPETNDEYLASIPDDDTWKPVILRAHEQLLALDPGYKISQIKSKFGGLRFYFTPADDADLQVYGRMHDVTDRAERDIDILEGRRRER